MVFSSTVFLFIFLPLLLFFYYIPIGKKNSKLYRNWKNAIILIFSIGFYAWGEPKFILIMLASVFFNWLIAIILANSNTHKKAWLSIAIILDLSLLAIFKYASFISNNISKLTGNSDVIISIALPIGISFFTFQMMSYVFDVYYGNASVQRNPFHVALYIMLFPQLVAGPIVRYKDIEEEISIRNESLDEFSCGVKRFIFGLGKKVLLANFLGQIADNVFDTYTNPCVLMAWLGAISYSLQIYFDFSGYSDMAIGIGKMFGFHFLENFNYPYISKSISDFWSRWHISLSSWFKDYLYIPLGGNRVGKARWFLNLFIVWLMTGIWHGANWTFLFWGLIYFTVLLLEKTTKFTDKLGVFKRPYTLLIVTIAWVFFRSSSISAGFTYIGYMFGINSSGFYNSGFLIYLKGTYIVLILSIIGCTPFLLKVMDALKRKNFAWIENIWLVLVFISSLVEIINATYNPFIYFNF